MFSDFKYDSKIVKTRFQYKDIVVLTRKKARNYNYLTEQGIPLILRNLDDSKCYRSKADYSFIEILENSSDLNLKQNFFNI
jgi:hypothetical protein